MAVKKGLGRGLDSLMNENATDNNLTAELRLSEIEPNKDQPRIHFDEQALQELAESISTHGLLQPLVVRPMVGGTYQIVAGERRWRASRIAGLTTVPVIIKSLNDKETMELALIENLQRMDLNPVEEAKGYSRLLKEFELTQEQVAERVGKSRSAVTNALRLLNLPDDMLNALSEGRISAGHARALLSFNDVALQQEAFIAAVEGASVRQIEAMAKAAAKPKAEKPTVKQDSFYREVELALKNETHRKAVIKPGKNGRGTITIEFYNKEELTELANKIVGK
ncbi:MAG: ParB/RepB/Spo0J family partition protein [Clostridia bacterium]|nr:ParB/RepB/Spo0J family partition protein [Clostridia bacterium]MBQ9919410.1 ParB/RepB/Spo0J family partition protein [Clostridia bacterium]